MQSKLLKRVFLLGLIASMSLPLAGCIVYPYPPRPYPTAHWVPGHYGPYGRWIPGHWRR